MSQWVIPAAANPPDTTLFDYQREGFEEFCDWFPKAGEPEALIALTTGLGKTITAAACIRKAMESSPVKVLWVTAGEELLEQSANVLAKHCHVSVAVEKAEFRAPSDARLVVASSASLKGRRLDAFARRWQPGLIVFDEAHHVMAATWNRIKTTFPDAKVLNLTATPYRMDLSNPMDLGRKLVVRTTSDGIRLGRLVPPRFAGTLKVDLDGVRVSLGDYAGESLSEVMCSETVMKASVDLIARHAPGRRGLVFCASVQHARDIAGRLRGAGLRVGEVYGETPQEERVEQLADMRAGSLDLLVNYNVFKEGFDLPAIDLVAILRPTKNGALYVQMLGRGLRVSPETGKVECLVIDAVNVAKRKTGDPGIFPLPTDDERRKLESTTGHRFTPARVFLHWFRKRDEIVAALEGGARPISGLNSPQALARVFFPAPGPSPAVERLINAIRPVWKGDSFPSGEDSYKTLFAPLRCNGLEGFVKILRDNGWHYLPHGTLPLGKHEFLDADKKAEKALENAVPQFNARVLADNDPGLKNFLMDIFENDGEAETLDNQAKNFYATVSLNGQDTIWPLTMESDGPRFAFVPVPEEGETSARPKKYFIRFKGKFYRGLVLRGTMLQFEECEPPALEEMPAWARDVAWAALPMTERQAPHVASILSLDSKQIARANISRLSASCLMTVHFARRDLAALRSQLAI